jgi:hypothetical protein
MTSGFFGIAAVNATNPQNPVLVGRFGMTTGAYDLAVRPESFPNANDARLCVIGAQFRLYAIPGLPSSVGTLALAGDQVSAAGDYAYVSNALQDALLVIDIVGPNTPALVATVPFPVPIGEIGDQAIDGDDLYVSADGFVHVFDLSVPTAPAYLTGVQTFSGGSLAAAGGLAFLANCCGTAIVSGSASGSPAFVGTFPAGGGQHVIAGDLLYSVDRSDDLRIIDVSAPQVAPLIGSLSLSEAGSAAIQGAIAFVSTTTFPGRLETIDISNPAAPAPLGTVNVLSRANDVALSGDFAFVACEDALRVVDVSDPSTPELVATASTATDNLAVALTGNLACVTSWPTGLMIFDVSIPTAPVLIRTVPPLKFGLYDVAAAGDYAFALESGPGLHVIDLSPPESATIIATVPINSGIGGVTAVNGLVYVSENDGMAIVDVTNPTLPSILGRVALPRDPRDLAVNDQFAYAMSSRLLHVIDVSDPTSPVLIANTSTPNFSTNIAGSDELVVVAWEDLFTLPLQCPTTTGAEGTPAPPQVGWLRAFPNPTRGLTTIEVATQGPHAELRIYDLAGRLVRSLPAASNGGARQAIVWDGRDARGRAVAGGAYWLRLEDGVSVRTSKITVIR